MASETGISWCDSTLNFWIGCTKVSPGCTNCYAAVSTPARVTGIKWGAGEPRQLTSVSNRNNIKRWSAEGFLQCGACGWRGGVREARKAVGCPGCGDALALREATRRVFCSSLSDVFDNEAPQEWRDAMFAEMEAAPNLDFLVLTKRIGNVRKMVPASWLKGGWPAHVWIGATIVNQEEAARDIPKLLHLPARIHFLSMEPLLGPVDLNAVWVANGILRNMVPALDRLSWAIVGGESGPGARPMHPKWARDIRDQCEAAGVKFLFKQHGEHTSTVPASHQAQPDTWVCIDGRTGTEEEAIADGGSWSGVWRLGKKATGNLLDGVKHEAWPT